MRPKCTKMNWKIFSICMVGLLNCAFRQNPAPIVSGRIQGTVCELDGCSPIKGARVAIELTNSSGLKRIVTTDDAGGFQFSQLPAGRYVLEAEANDFVSVAALPLIAIGDGGKAEDVKVFMRPLGSISGQAIDENGKPVAFAQIAATSFLSGITATATADDHGEFRVARLGSAEYTLRMAPPADAPAMRDYLSVFYPGTTNRDAAERIFIGPGIHIEGIVLKLSSRGVRITGRFVNDSGKPVQALARLVPRTSSISLSPDPSNPGSMSEQFEIRAVPPGSYFLYAITEFQTGLSRSYIRVAPQWVRVPIEVGDQNIEGMTVPILPTGAIHGRVQLSPDVTGPVKVDFSGLNLQLQPAEELPPLIPWRSATEISSDGQFEFEHLSEVNCSLTLLSDEWFITQLLLEGQDVTSSGFSAAPGEDRELDVVISNAGGSLTGFLKDAQDRTVPGGRVVLLRDRPNAVNPAVTKIALSDSTGEFHVQGIAPGYYTAIAFPPEEQSGPMFFGNAQWVGNYARYGQRLQILPHVASRIDLVPITP